MDRSITFLTSYPDSGPRLSTPRIAYRLGFDRAIYLSDTYHQELRQRPTSRPRARRARGSVVLFEDEQLALAPDAGEGAAVGGAGGAAGRGAPAAARPGR